MSATGAEAMPANIMWQILRDKVESFLPPRALHIASVADQSERAVLTSLASLANRGSS